jgi:cytochrome P450
MTGQPFRRHSQLDYEGADPSQMTTAVEEILRFDGPANVATLRFTTEAIRVGDVDVPQREIVMIWLLAANRDAERFDDPERLDVTRKSNVHLAFGSIRLVSWFPRSQGERL